MADPKSEGKSPSQPLTNAERIAQNNAKLQARREAIGRALLQDLNRRVAEQIGAKRLSGERKP